MYCSTTIPTPRHRSTRFLVRAGILSLAIGILLPRAAGAGWEYWDNARIFAYGTDHYAAASDGAGGLLAVASDHDVVPNRVGVSRVDHAGNESWGDDGILVPLEAGAQSQRWPVAAAAGSGGDGYFAYRTLFGTHDNVNVAHFRADGSFDWAIPVADIGLPATYDPDARLVPDGSGGAIVAWTQYAPVLKLRAARVSAGGAVQWAVDINQDYRHGEYIGFDKVASWDAQADGAGGLLVTWLRVHVGAPEVGAQRVSAAGSVLWGADGHLLFSGYPGDWHDPQVVGDGLGGAFIAVSQLGRLTAQHVTAGGADGWATGGIQVQDSGSTSTAYSTHPALCGDGAGGFIVAHGNEDSFAQRVDAGGGLLWGAGVTLCNAPGWQQGAKLAADGAGGAIIAWEDYYYALPGQHWRTISALRLNAAGGVAWSCRSPDCIFYCLWNVYDPFDLRVVSDGSGGAMFAWRNDTIHGVQANVMAKGVNAGGKPPYPTVTLLEPDAGLPNATMPVGILGDYLDTQASFVLRGPGAAAVPVTGLQALNFQLLVGQVDLAGAPGGGYDLVASVRGTPCDTMPHAFGVGDSLQCFGEDPFPDEGGAPLLAGSSRRVAFDAQGNAHVTWAEWNAAAQRFRLFYRHQVGSGWSATQRYYQSADTLAAPTIAIGPTGQANVAFVVRLSRTQSQLVQGRFSSSGTFSSATAAVRGPIADPVLAVTGDGAAHVVFSAGSPGETDLQHAVFTTAGLQSVNALGAGTNSRNADLALRAGGGGLACVFARNSFLPGVQEQCYMLYDVATAAWTTPETIGFGATIGSPSVACGGDDALLFACTSDMWTGTPWLYTRLRTGSGVLHDAQFRWTAGAISRVSVSAATGVTGDPFYLLTLEDDGASRLVWRSGDGDVFFPRKQLNEAQPVLCPGGAVARDGSRLFAFWAGGPGGDPLHQFECQAFVAAVGDEGGVPARTLQLACAPNPFNPAAAVTFDLPAGGEVSLRVYDLQGRLVRTLLHEEMSGGRHRAEWDGRDERGEPAASGVYLVRLLMPGRQLEVVGKVALLR